MLIIPLANTEETIGILLPQVKSATNVPTAVLTVFKKPPKIEVAGITNETETIKKLLVSDNKTYKKLKAINNPAVIKNDKLPEILSIYGIDRGVFIPIRAEEPLGQLILKANRIEMAWLQLGAHLAQGLLNARKYEELCSEVVKDELTGLLNRRGFKDCVEREIARSLRFGGTFSLAYYDLDGFKDVNDTLGHQEGDILLCLIAKTMSKQVRSTDILARLGGDEFAVCLTGTNLEVGAMVVKRVGDAIFNACNEYLNKAVITVSAGVVGFPRDGSDIDSLIAAADKAMYHSKKRKGTQECVVTIFNELLT